MTINTPKTEEIPRLRRLWQQAFGDTNAFLDDFFDLAFSPERCRCLSADGQLTAVLYWFDCDFADQKIAYLYGVATDKAFQNRGFCRTLMENTHAHLKALGYDGAVLVPGSPGLFAFYEKQGYRTAAYIRAFSCSTGDTPTPLRRIDAAEYAALRRQMLPSGGVVQEGAALALLGAQAAFYAGDDQILVAVVHAGEELFCPELLGPDDAAPDILKALGAKQGRFRTPGSETPFAMYLPLSEKATPPAYFGLALD